MKEIEKLLCILLLGTGAAGAQAQTNYVYNGPNTANMIWPTPANYLLTNGVAPGTFPCLVGDTLTMSGVAAANDYQLNGNWTLAQFNKVNALGKSSAITPGTVANATLTWDTGVPGVQAVFQDFGASGSADNGDLRCAVYVNMVLNSSLLWQGSTERSYASRFAANGTFGTTGTGQLWSDISGAGKLTVQWNGCKEQTISSGVGGAGQKRYQPWLLSGSFWQGFAILIPEQAKLAVFEQGANV